MYLLLHTHQQLQRWTDRWTDRQMERLTNTPTKRTFAIVDQQAVGSAEVHVVADFHVVQMLRHLASLRELGVNVLEVHLSTKCIY